MSAGTVGAHIIHKADAHTLVADTYVKTGWTFDGRNTIRFFVNGVQVGADLKLNTAEVPDGIRLLAAFGAKAGAAAGKILETDWFRVAALR
jgi:hypothetical protein